MKYQLLIKQSAEKELERLNTRLRERILARLLLLEHNPRPSGSIKLQAGKGYRLRIGDYRVLYEIDDTARVVTIFAVRHRREAYR